MMLLVTSAAAAAARRRRKRPRDVIFLLLTTVASGLLPSVASFGFSTNVGAPQLTSDGALVARGSVAALGSVARCGKLQQQQQQQQQGQQPRKRRREHDITCKVASPRRYGSADWFSNIQNLPKSRLLYNIKEHLFYNTSFAFVVSMIHLLTPQHVIDDLHVSAIPHSIMSGALGLLLVFRTNAAYNRFWEARKVWGSLINTCRNIARLSFVALGPDSPEWLELKEYLRMFPFLLKQHLQDTRVDEELNWVSLPMDKVLRLQEDPNPPMMDIQIMTEIIASAYSEGGSGESAGGVAQDYTSVTYRMEIEKCLSSLMNDLGKCERILTTPVPRGYSRHTSRFLTVYGFTLPVVLVPHTELFTAPVVAAVCWGLFSIEEIAYFIEQPFDPEYRQLDLMAYSQKVARDIDRMTASSVLGREGPRLPVSVTTAGADLLPYSPPSPFSLSSSQQQQRQLEDFSLPAAENNGQAGAGGGGNDASRGPRHTDGGSAINGRQARDDDGESGGHDVGSPTQQGPWGGGDGGGGRGGGRGGGSGGGGADVNGEGRRKKSNARKAAAERSRVDGLSASWRGDPEDDIVGG
ncbi:unnamed protein product [Pylaiella littoralis]